MWILSHTARLDKEAFLTMATASDVIRDEDGMKVATRKAKSSKTARVSLLAFLFAFSLLMLVRSDRSLLANLQLPSIVQSAVEGTLFQKDNQNRSSIVAANIEQIIQRLTRSSMPRYYVYEDDRFVAQVVPEDEDPSKQERGRMRERYEGFAQAEEHIINVLANHSLRTRDAEEADLFFVPISLTRHLIERRKGHTAAEVLFALYNQTFFQSNEGHRHFMILQLANMWSWEHLELYKGRTLRISHQYRRLWNMTIGKVFDQEGCKEAKEKGLLEGSGFKPMMLDCGVTMSRSSFSLNFIPLPSFPFIRASMEKFRNASWDFFYYSRIEPSMFNSTPYRHALFNDTIRNALPGSSIGIRIRPYLWMEHFLSSRFCLVVRGDNPLSRSQLRAVKVGCIPVIVSNLLEYYAPIFKSSIRVSDYSIMVDEDEYLADPVGELMKVKNMSEEILCEKMEYLKLAQRLLIPDDPESLFVPALLHEVNESIKRASNHSNWPW